MARHAKTTAAAVQPHVIHPSTVYTLESAQQALGLPKLCLGAEVRKGRLRVSKRSHKYFFLGEWLLQWLREGEVLKARKETEAVA